MIAWRVSQGTPVAAVYDRRKLPAIIPPPVRNQPLTKIRAYD